MLSIIIVSWVYIILYRVWQIIGQRNFSNSYRLFPILFTHQLLMIRMYNSKAVNKESFIIQIDRITPNCSYYYSTNPGHCIFNNFYLYMGNAYLLRIYKYSILDLTGCNIYKIK